MHTSTRTTLPLGAHPKNCFSQHSLQDAVLDNSGLSSSDGQQQESVSLGLPVRVATRLAIVSFSTFETGQVRLTPSLPHSGEKYFLAVGVKLPL